MKCPKLHYKQIPTTYRAIKNALSEDAYPAISSLLKCFSYAIDSSDYITQLLVTASCFEWLSRLVYKSSDGEYKKLPEKKYKKRIFEGPVETVQEVFDVVQKYGVSEAGAWLIYKKVWQISDLVCPMIACISEQAFVSEYAYAIDYVMRSGSELPKPDMLGLFPKNYPDYRYWEGQTVERIRTFVEV